jgi:2-polyprenyl-6-methoxyphenol hydroxylase-like FAD-dependent oxidoreductase
VTACTQKDDRVEVSYTKIDGNIAQLRGRFLVGADGKRGLVRKKFLEPKGIQQLVGMSVQSAKVSVCGFISNSYHLYSHEYSATWIAANLHIKLPTPQSHPEFPLWKAGITPEQVWDLFWPKGFQYVPHPGSIY